MMEVLIKPECVAHAHGNRHGANSGHKNRRMLDDAFMKVVVAREINTNCSRRDLCRHDLREVGARHTGNDDIRRA